MLVVPLNVAIAPLVWLRVANSIIIVVRLNIWLRGSYITKGARS